MQESQEIPKRPHKNTSFPISKALALIEPAIAPYKKAALFELAEEGFDSVFQQAAACIISVRTRDETTIPVAKALFAKARNPKDFEKLSIDQITELISASTFARTKAVNIKKIAQIAQEKYGGQLPCQEEVLLSLPGIGPKCGNLVMGIACNESRIGVDIHVHRVCNRWGYVSTRTPLQTLSMLEARLPQKFWVDLNRLLVPFGKHICTGIRPKCSTCPLRHICPKVGVTDHR